MKVLILNNRYPSKPRPFVASYVQTIEGLLQRSFDVERLVGTRNASGKMGQLLDIFLYKFKLLRSSQFQKADVVFANHFNLYWKVLFKKIKSNQKLVIHWHGSELFGSARFRNFEAWRASLVFNKATHIVPSEYFKREVLKEFPKLKNVVVVPSGGIDADVFAPAKGRVAEKVCIGFASHLNKEKGADILLNLLKAKEQLESQWGVQISFKALNYGVKDIDLLPQLESAGLELQEPIPKSKMPDFYGGLDVLLFPTKRKSESLGLVPLEAMACNVPVLCPQEFACPEYCIPGVSGELFQLGNTSSLHTSLNKLVMNRGNYNPRKIILEKYTQDVAAEAYAGVIYDKKSF